MELMILVALIGLNGLLAMSETALVSSRRGRLARLAEGGDRAAKAAMALNEEPQRFLSTIQIGITSIGILSGIVGEAILAEPFALWLQQFGVAREASEWGATGIVVVSLTYVTIVLGELVPKRIGQISAEGIARLVARPVYLLACMARPFLFLLSTSTTAVLKLLGQNDKNEPLVTEEEIHAVLEEGSEAGVIEKQEHEMVRNVFRLDERPIGTLMVPRSEIVALDATQPIEETLKRAVESVHSRFPVCQGDFGQILGTISAKELFKRALSGSLTDLGDRLEPAVFVPESLTGMVLLEQLRTSGTPMVFVVDEYGEVQGIVTLQDLLEAVTGEFQPDEPEDAWAIQREDGSWLLDGLIPIPELKDRLELKSVPEEDKGRFHTLSGLIMWLLGRLPATGDVATWEGWRLEIVDLDGKRIDKVLAERLPERDADAGGVGETPAPENH